MTTLFLDPDCKLRVPDIVQKQLRNLSVNKLTESSLIIAARRAIRYLTNNLSEDSKYEHCLNCEIQALPSSHFPK